MPDENSFKNNLHSMAALLGWYLMSPPGVDGFMKPEASFSKWYIVAKSKSEDECEAGLGRVRARLGNAILETALTGTDPFIRQIGESLVDLRCVSSDDPRLKEK